MPLNVRRLGALVILVLIFVFGVLAQSPTSVDVMKSRISKAKALVAVKNYAAAIYELEGIKRETNDVAVSSVVQVMLINCYLEQLDYKRAQSLLTEIFNAQKNNKSGANYFAVAGQVVRGAKNQSERYKSLGLNTADRNLPTEAIADVEKMRETVEMVITQSKTLGEAKKLIPDSMALLEEAGNARSTLARDEYDARRWKDEVADAREKLTASRTTVINAVDDGTPATFDVSKTIASTGGPIITMSPEPNSLKSDKPAVPVSTPAQNQTAVNQPIVEKKDPVINPVVSPSNVETSPARNEPTAKLEPVVEKKAETPKEESLGRERTVKNQETIAKAAEEKPAEAPKDNSPLQVGSLIEYATAKVAPSYPPAARTMRTTGTVKIDVLLNEDGTIAEVQKKSGPTLLQQAALDALKRWKFKPFTRDGQPVKATGYISFNFNL